MTMAGSNGQSVVRELVIQNQTGLHARPAARSSARLTPFRRNNCDQGRRLRERKSIMGLMTLAAGQGTTLVVEAQGDDAEKAADAIQTLVESKFNEA